MISLFGEKRARASGTRNTAPRTDPTAMAVKRYPSCEGSRRSSCNPTNGINAGMIEIKNENNPIL